MSYLDRLKRSDEQKKSLHSPQTELTKPPKAPSVSFGSTVQGAYENISAANSALEKVATSVMVPFDPLRKHLTADDEQTIRAWLALIGETDPAAIAEVLSQCQQDAEARDYFISKARVELRQGKVAAKLKANPELDHVSETHDDVEPEAVLLTLAIRGKGVCELRIPKSRYDAFALLELIEKHTTREILQ